MKMIITITDYSNKSKKNSGLFDFDSIGFYYIIFGWLTFGVKAPATMGDIIPGIVANVFDRPNITPAYLK